MGEKVLTAISPGQLMVKIVKDELVELMGTTEAELDLKGNPTVILIAGLQGSGKTTFSGKLASFLKNKKNKKPLLVAADIYRPAAIDQLKVLGVDLPGGMQDYWAVPSDRLLRVPDSISDDHAPLIEPLAVATHDVTRAGVKAGDAVVVFGGGPIGTLIALVSRHRGARVKVVEINPHRVEMLKALGL